LRQSHDEGDKYLAARAAGDFEVAAVIAGDAVDLVDAIEPEGRIVRRIVAQSEARLPGAQAISGEPFVPLTTDQKPVQIELASAHHSLVLPPESFNSLDDAVRIPAQAARVL
jgi:hypothetical protein